MARTASPRKSPRRPTTVAQGAEHYGVSTRTIHRWIAAGLLPAYRLGPRLLRIDLDDLDQLARPVPAAGGSNGSA